MGIVPLYSMTSVACAVTLVVPLKTSIVMQFWLKGALMETVTRSCGTAAEYALDCNVPESSTWIWMLLACTPCTPSCDNKLVQ